LAGHELFVTDVRPKETIADDIPPLAFGHAEPAEPERALERPDDMETASLEEIGVAAHCS
jgi:hypothetical protein